MCLAVGGYMPNDECLLSLAEDQRVHGHLVVEIIPQHGGLPFPDNSAGRAGYAPPRAPKRGEHITVTGPYVLDTNALHDLIFPGTSVKNLAGIDAAWNVTV